jgi:pilus assembly protein Flp/PilA
MLQFLVTLQTLVTDRVEASKDRGATAVEYGLMVALIAIAIIATVLLLGQQLNAVFTTITDALASFTPAAEPSA